MKQFILNNKMLCGIIGAIVLGVITMSFQDSPFIHPRLGVQEVYEDTTKPKKKLSQAEIDSVMKEVQKAMEQVAEEMKNMDMSQVTAEVNKALKEVDVQKIMNEVQQSLKEVDMKKIMEDVNNSLKDIDSKKIEADVKDIQQRRWIVRDSLKARCVVP